MKSKKLLSSKGYYDITCYTGDDITDKMISKCFELDEYFFEDKYLYDHDKIRNLIKNNNDMCLVLYNEAEQKVIAYSFYIFITKEALEMYKANKISYFTLGESLIKKPKEGDRIVLFNLSDACRPGWDFVKMHRLMSEYNSYILCNLAEINIKVTDVCIDVVCGYDKILLKQFHIENKVETNHNSEFFWGKFNPQKVWTYCKYSERLIELYSKVE